MSYCRFSSDDYKCDVYVYESDYGFEVSVAGRMYVTPEPMPPDVSLPHGSPDFARAWVNRAMRVREIIERSELRAIELEHAGDHSVFETPGECAEYLSELAAIGYRVPHRAIRALRQDEADRVCPAFQRHGSHSWRHVAPDREQCMRSCGAERIMRQIAADIAVQLLDEQCPRERRTVSAGRGQWRRARRLARERQCIVWIVSRAGRWIGIVTPRGDEAFRPRGNYGLIPRPIQRSGGPRSAAERRRSLRQYHA